MLGLAAPAQASEAQSSEARFEVNGTRLSVPIKTWKDLRDQNVVRQQLDYSCGAAAMATLMTYGIGRPTSEAEVIAAMITDLVENERETREKEGFSLLDMKRYAESIGLQAQGFRVGAEVLDQLQGQVIVFIRPQGYEHFSVLRGVEGETVYLADPARGNVRLSRTKFLHQWLGPEGNGIVFAVERPGVTFNPNNPLALPAQAGAVRPERLAARDLIEVRPGGFLRAIR